ncbi:MAG: putative glycoside hydrolase [Spirochaetales bacterium]|uniref:Glycoside hydrolase n=1 Tax=Candidatus Thalassospirochaeta sargassi TaxID=3119039 RepID=A0AAJ1IH48_9SPIO|nr:putative glycoside hydrolase [Spirochaetales bacterium]
MTRLNLMRTVLAVTLLSLFLTTVSAADAEQINVRFLNISRTIETSKGIKYAAAVNDGFLVSTDGGRMWIKRNNGLPAKIVYPFTDEETETLTSIGFDPLDESKLVCTTASKLFVSLDSGRNWKNIPIKSPISRSNILTGAAPSPFDDDTYLISTSFSGIFETTDAGDTWTEVAEKSIIYRGAGFNEEIAAAVYSPVREGVIYLAYSFGNGLYESTPDRRSWKEIDGLSQEHSIQTMQFTRSKLQVAFLDGTASYLPSDGSWSRMNEHEVVLSARTAAGAARARRLEAAADHQGMYIGPWHASGERLQNHLDFMERNGLESIVIDIKDDFGYLTYDSKLDLPNSIGAVKDRIHIKTLVAEAHKRGFYVIGRVVVFKDQQLFNYNNYVYTLKDKYSGEPWRHLIKSTNDDTGEIEWEQREYWVDPFNPAVWEYNADIAEELQDLGVDEIQFDYIRFPSDGDTSRISFSGAHPGMSRINALESFFRLVRERVHIPISTDLYGFNSYYRMGNWIGQNIEMLAEYVDVICPMYYPSHFPRNFMKDVPYLDRAEDIYYEGTLRAAEIVAGRSIIRPYVQAFLLPAEYYMEEEEYQEYLLKQLKGCRDADSSGWTLWNMSNRYYMVPEPLYEHY